MSEPLIGDYRNNTGYSIEIWDGEEWVLVNSEYLNIWEQGYESALQDCVNKIYKMCDHTKYAGCDPCIHDEMVSIINSLGGSYE